MITKKFIVQLSIVDLKFHEILVEIHKILKFLVILLNFTTTTLPIDISKGMYHVFKMSILLESLSVALSNDMHFIMWSMLVTVLNKVQTIVYDIVG